MLNLKFLHPLGSFTRSSSPNHAPRSLILPYDPQSEELETNRPPSDDDLHAVEASIEDVGSVNHRRSEEEEGEEDGGGHVKPISDADSTLDPIFLCLVDEIKSANPRLMTSQSLSGTNQSSSTATRSSLITHRTDQSGWSSGSGSLNDDDDDDEEEDGSCSDEDQRSAELATNNAINKGGKYRIGANRMAGELREVIKGNNHGGKHKTSYNSFFRRLTCTNIGLGRSTRKKRFDREAQRAKARINTANQILTMIKAQLVLPPECGADRPANDAIPGANDAIPGANHAIPGANDAITSANDAITGANDGIKHTIIDDDEHPISEELEDLFLRYLRLTTPDRSTALTFLQAFNPHFNHTLIVP